MAKKINIDKELYNEVANFVYSHEWDESVRTAALYTGFHMVNIFLSKKEKSVNFINKDLEVNQ